MSTIKCVMLGDLEVGKTCLFMSYTVNKFPSEYVPTVVNTYSMTVMIREEEYTLKMCDTSGHDDYDRLRPLSYADTDIFLVCFSVVSPSTVYSIREKWVPEILFHCPRVPFLLVGTQVDLRDDGVTLETLAKNKQQPVAFESGERLAHELKAVKYMECSALTQKGVQNVFEEAIRVVLETLHNKSSRCVLL